MNSIMKKHIQIQEDIKEMILNNQLQQGDKLASEAEFMSRYSVSSITVRKALGALAEEGFIRRIQGKGSFVNDVSAVSASSMIAVLMPYSNNPDVSHLVILQGIQRMLREEKYSLIIEWYEKGIETERHAIKRVVEKNIDGFLLYPNAPDEDLEMLLYVNGLDIPNVWLDRYNYMIESSFVSSDNYKGGILATQHLCDLGHKNIVFLEHEFSLSSEQERYAGFNHVLERNNLKAHRRFTVSDSDIADLCERIRSRDVTGIFCVNDKVAVETISMLQGEGISVPEDVSIVGFDNWDGLKLLSQRLTTIQQDFMALGMMSAKLLIDIISNDDFPAPLKYVTPVSLVKGDTTSPPR